MSSKSRGYLASPEGLERLKAAKVRLGWSFKEIGERAGVSADTVSRLFHPERGRQVTKASLEAVAVALELEPEAIVLQEEQLENNDESEGFVEARRRIQQVLNENATELNLSYLGLDKIPQELGQLGSLTRLDLSGNPLTTVPKELGQLGSLTRLDLSGNQLTTVPKELGQLGSLTTLYLYGNQLTTVPKELGQLGSLTELHLDVNQLTTVPKELGQLGSLTELHLNENQLTTVPKELSQLASLTELYLHGNQHLNIPTEILGPTWQQVSREGAQRANPQEILAYYFQTLSKGQPLNEAKLILVGFGAVGKTSLVNRFIHEKFDPKSQKTEGIQITPWNIHLKDDETIKLHTWDFGGQEIMHSTHQFFLTERSLYLLVLNGRQGHEDEDAEYWLELIQSFGSDSPVIIVLNKIKEQPFDVNRRALQQKFPNICEFIQTDCATKIGIERLKTAIKRETDQLDGLRKAFPASWFTIKDRLSEMADNYISFEQYQEICDQDGETDPSAQETLASALHNLGIALNYKDDSRLRDTHVLNPHWLTNGIYTIINNHAISETKGEMRIAQLTKILNRKQYPRARHGFLMELMRKFELCFPFQDDPNKYLIPDLLDKQQPEAAGEFIPAECLNFRYEYPILPEGLLPRFIVRTHVLSEHQLRWRTGVILNFEGNHALIKADRADNCVTINVSGPSDSRRRLLAIIRSDFDRIHRNFKNLKIEELVPVPNHPEITVRYKDLLVREKRGSKTFEEVIGDDLLELNVQDLLNGVDLDGRRSHLSKPGDRGDCSTALNLFYSYAHKDEVLRNQLETHLKILERQSLIRPWHDRQIIPGEQWADEIDRNLEQADIILLLISSDFIVSNYCYDKEMKRAVERHESGEAVVIPIILRRCDWQDTPFGKLQGLPKDMQPITQWDDRDEAWYNVEQGIKGAIAGIQNR